MRHGNRLLHRRSRWIWPLALLLLVLGVWLLPLQGQVVILTNSALEPQAAWPAVWLEPQIARPGEPVTLYVRDNAPWPHLKLLVDGEEAPRDEGFLAGSGPWTWRWSFSAPARQGAEAVLYHSCHIGCQERARIALGARREATTAARRGQPTLLGVVFADPDRNWHGRSGWAVELTYAERPDDPDWGIDGLARRVERAERDGLRVLVRVAFDMSQSLPPDGDELALARYLEYCARLARDQRLSGVYAYFIGSGYNSDGENRLAPDRPTTPEWYARVFNGYGMAPSHADNVVQTMRAINDRVRLLIGPTTPWSEFQDGALPDQRDLPWLNYFNTLVAHVDESAQAKHRLGMTLTGPDGFALQAPGRPQAVAAPAQEPRTDHSRPDWHGAQAGFRVYRDWLAIINRYPTTRGLPAYITSTNTFTADSGVPPAQNYPAGWLTAAFEEISGEPQIQALCWFVDAPFGGMWSEFSLTARTGLINDAADEFDRLLQQR